MPRRKKEFRSGSSGLVSTNKEKPVQRNAANARERARMRVLSRAFCRLKTTLPWVPADTKLSKLDTLRLASSYISHLKGILRDPPSASSPQTSHQIHPAITLTWPFGFTRAGGVGCGSGSAEGGGGSGGSGDESDDSSWEEVNPCSHLSTPPINYLHGDTHLHSFHPSMAPFN